LYSLVNERAPVEVSMIPPQARELHRTLSKPAADLLDLAAANPECLQRPQFTRDLPDWIAVYTPPIQAWPTILAGARLAEIRRATVALPRLVKSLPERIFHNDAAAIARFYGAADEAGVRAMLSEPDGLATALARGDYLDTAAGFKCLEMNLSACLGSWEIRFFADRVLAQPWLAELLRGVPAAFVDPLFVLFSHLVETVLESGLDDDGEVNVAFLMPPAVFALSHPSFCNAVAGEYTAFLAARHPSLRGGVLFSTYDRVRGEGGRVFLDGLRLHAVVDYHDPFFDGRMDPLVEEGFKAGQLHLYNSPAACMLSDKRNIALLSEHQESDLFSAAERQLIRDHIPWSRLARPGWTEFRGERVDLASFAAAERERLVLKRGRGGQGDAVVLGPLTSEAQWREAVARAFAAGDWILQERLDSLPYWYQAGDYGAAPHEVIWGLFAFGDRYAGGNLRMLPLGHGGVVNTSRGAADGLILEIEEDGATA
jgi:hypothetical protein